MNSVKGYRLLRHWSWWWLWLWTYDGGDGGDGSDGGDEVSIDTGNYRPGAET